MTLYETVFVTAGDLSPQRVDELIEKVKSIITQKGGEVTLLDKWGKRRLAYPIGRQREGIYTFLQFKAPPTVIAEINQLYRVSEDVIRDIICQALPGKPASPHMALPAPAPHGAAHPASPAAAPVLAPAPEVGHAEPATTAPAQ